MSDLIAPFPYFGGKAKIARVVWEHFGNVDNYVEPFAGSLAVLLGRPAEHQRKAETVNDLDNYLTNLWRAVQAEPDAVAYWADWPVNETDLHARHIWLVTHGRDRLVNLDADPTAYDAQVAGWWLWGICSWIGSGWCSGAGPWQVVDGRLVANTDGQGINRQLPHLGNSGQGINRQRPHLGNSGRGINRQRVNIYDYMQALASRLRDVRVCCGDWQRVVTPGALAYGANVGVFLDPPYAAETGRDMNLYNHENDVSAAVREWAFANGDNPRYRIALCGYEGEHDMPGWHVYHWKAVASYKTSRGDQNGNRHRERVWFSPHCLHIKFGLFDAANEP